MKSINLPQPSLRLLSLLFPDPIPPDLLTKASLLRPIRSRFTHIPGCIDPSRYEINQDVDLWDAAVKIWGCVGEDDDGEKAVKHAIEEEEEEEEALVKRRKMDGGNVVKEDVTVLPSLQKRQSSFGSLQRQESFASVASVATSEVEVTEVVMDGVELDGRRERWMKVEEMGENLVKSARMLDGDAVDEGAGRKEIEEGENGPVLENVDDLETAVKKWMDAVNSIDNDLIFLTTPDRHALANMPSKHLASILKIFQNHCTDLQPRHLTLLFLPHLAIPTTASIRDTTALLQTLAKSHPSQTLHGVLVPLLTRCTEKSRFETAIRVAKSGAAVRLEIHSEESEMSMTCGVVCCVVADWKRSLGQRLEWGEEGIGIVQGVVGEIGGRKVGDSAVGTVFQDLTSMLLKVFDAKTRGESKKFATMVLGVCAAAKGVKDKMSKKALSQLEAVCGSVSISLRQTAVAACQRIGAA
ncbi:hypothetical protein HDU97_009798 [Phlyctochytrium planicorne]|nr:hypothetical protein HDU97_009798 [Phlyctochytrium planicorne]